MMGNFLSTRSSILCDLVILIYMFLSMKLTRNFDGVETKNM